MRRLESKFCFTLQDAAELVGAEEGGDVGSGAEPGSLSGTPGLVLGPQQHGAALVGRLVTMSAQGRGPGERALRLAVQV